MKLFGKQKDSSSQDWIKQGDFLPAFWTIGSALSILLNIVLIIIVIVLSGKLFSLKQMVTNDVLGGLYSNFIKMDQATIITTVEVSDTIPVQFDLLLNQKTYVRLTEAVTIKGASVTLSTGGLNIVKAPTDIILPAGTVLPIALDMIVPVNTTVPVVLTVPVEIPLSETELHEPFVGLQDVVAPFYWQLYELPDSWKELLGGE
jgi:hypothetical protein